MFGSILRKTTLACARALSNSTASDRILVTGGSGFLGGYIVKQLIGDTNKGLRNTVIGTVDFSDDTHLLHQILDEPDHLNLMERYHGDITDTEFIFEVFKSFRPTKVIHLAAVQIPSCRENPVRGAMVNVIGTLNILEAAKLQRSQHPGSISGVCYGSSAAVAGAIGDYNEPIPDRALHRSRTHYGVFKTANEGNAWCYWNDHGLPSIALRPHTVFGVGREVGLTSGPTKAIKSALLSRPYEIGFTGRARFSYVKDLASLFIDCADRLENFSGAAALNVPGFNLDVEKDFLPLITDAISNAQITCRGPELPLAYNFDESGLKELLGKPLELTKPSEAIQEMIEHFNKVKKTRYWHERDLEVSEIPK